MESPSVTTVYDKNNPFLAKLIKKEVLTKPGSEKETIHFVIDISGSGLQYHAGDWIGIYPKNCSRAVSELISKLNFHGEERVVLPKSQESISLKDALTHHFSITDPSKKFMEWVVKERLEDTPEKSFLEQLLLPENENACREYLESRDWIDVIIDCKSSKISAQEFVNSLKRLMPRLYSIASSPKIYPNEVHLTISVIRYQSNGRNRIGIASTYLADRIDIGQEVIPIFISTSPFKLPENASKDVIMVGPGTGIAPFRGFIQERSQYQNPGRSWLFFGEQRRAHDFLYEEEWNQYLKKNHLTRLDLAFSRDQEHKVYVQDKIREHSKELWSWIDGGAYFYICGDAKSMAKDVEETLLEIFQHEGKMSSDVAKEYIKTMKKEKRYQRDVY